MDTNSFIIKKVIERYSKEYDIQLQLCYKHFDALEKFLDLANGSNLPCFPDKTIDNFWHTFIIHTKIYESYCKNKYGKFIHHNPIDKISTPIEGFYCSYDNIINKFEYKLMIVNQAVCDGGGGSCSSCNSDG